jgi:hypothetical protein
MLPKNLEGPDKNSRKIFENLKSRVTCPQKAFSKNTILKPIYSGETVSLKDLKIKFCKFVTF